MAVAAVDTADKMAGLAGQVAEMVPRGLMTLERAHLGGGPVRPPRCREADRLRRPPGPCGRTARVPRGV